jgi:hypothetical protein
LILELPQLPLLDDLVGAVLLDAFAKPLVAGFPHPVHQRLLLALLNGQLGEQLTHARQRLFGERGADPAARHR